MRAGAGGPDTLAGTPRFIVHQADGARVLQAAPSAAPLPCMPGRWIGVNRITTVAGAAPSGPALLCALDVSRRALLLGEKAAPSDAVAMHKSPQVPLTSAAERSLRVRVTHMHTQDCGTTGGTWLGWGSADSFDRPTDQGADDGRSLCFDSAPTASEVRGVCRATTRNPLPGCSQAAVLGVPQLDVTVSVDAPTALLARATPRAAALDGA